MDSANSGSSGRDDNHDFAADSISASHHHHLQFRLPPHHPQNTNFFDANNPPHNLNNLPNDNNNHDLIWPRSASALRSEPNFAYSFGTLMSPLASSISLPSTAVDPTATVQAMFPGSAPLMDHSPRPPAQPSNHGIKNPKKRTRASRRAPTTVLTTDVTNFRQMVQEFTGIPASPFSSASPYSRTFDLFSSPSALRIGGGLSLHSLRPLYSPRPSRIPPLPFSSLNPNSDENAMNYHLLNLQQQQQHQRNNLNNTNNNIPLQLGANSAMNLPNLSGFLSRESTTIDAEGRRWKASGETVGRNINDGGIEEAASGSHNLVGFDGGRGAAVPPPPQSGAYNLNTVEKVMENAAGGSASAGGEGTLGSWICTSH